MGPRAIRGVANLAPNTELGEVQQDANRFVKCGPIAPSKYCDSRTHGILTAMYTTETSTGSAKSPCRARAARVLHQVLPQGAKTRVQVFADIQNLALCAHCVHGIPNSPSFPPTFRLKLRFWSPVPN